jgi:hypothetical protein
MISLNDLRLARLKISRLTGRVQRFQTSVVSLKFGKSFERHSGQPPRKRGASRNLGNLRTSGFRLRGNDDKGTLTSSSNF